MASKGVLQHTLNPDGQKHSATERLALLSVRSGWQHPPARAIEQRPRMVRPLPRRCPFHRPSPCPRTTAGSRQRPSRPGTAMNSRPIPRTLPKSNRSHYRRSSPRNKALRRDWNRQAPNPHLTSYTRARDDPRHGSGQAWRAFLETKGPTGESRKGPQGSLVVARVGLSPRGTYLMNNISW